MNKAIKLFCIFFISILYSSCDPACYNSVNITVSNETKQKILIYCEYPLGPITTDNRMDTVLADESNILVSTYSTGPTIGPEYYYSKLWFYNPLDSTYIVCTNYKIEENGIKNIIYIDNLLQEKGKNGKHNSQNYTTEFTYIINDALLSKMTKNTALTDSVFGLKK